MRLVNSRFVKLSVSFSAQRRLSVSFRETRANVGANYFLSYAKETRVETDSTNVATRESRNENRATCVIGRDEKNG